MRARRWIDLMMAVLVWGSHTLRAQSDSIGKQALERRPFIGRLVGVYDVVSGDPIEGAEVYDMMSKMSAITTKTGTVALNFVDSAGSLLRVRKVGYEAQLLTVSNREIDPPITVVMVPAGTVLPTVVTTASRRRGLADTVRKLESVGFYDRREKSGASSIAFVLGEKIQDMMTFDDFQSRTGRPICATNLWIDGMRVAPGSGGRKFNLRKNPVDEVLTVREVAAVENYRTAEVPVEFNSTRPPGAADCGATLIWTR